jgi:hypothetical protein
VSRLTAAHRATERLRGHGHAPYRAELDAITLALGRMAQLEKVAELARDVTGQYGSTLSDHHPEWLLELALIELDNHPDTREPTTTEKDG